MGYIAVARGVILSRDYPYRGCVTQWTDCIPVIPDQTRNPDTVRARPRFLEIAMLLTRKSALFLLISTFYLAMGACADDGDDGGGGGTDPGKTKPVGTTISASEGGEIAMPDGKATLIVPAYSLATDTEISAAMSPASARTLSNIYEFGPSGLTFQQPAWLMIDLDPGLVAGREVAVGLKTGDSFTPLPGSNYQNGKLGAPIQHF